MGTYAATGHTTYVGGYDMTGDLNQTSLSLSTDALDRTPFNPAAATPGRVRQAGLQDVQSTVAGFWQGGSGSGTVDPTAWAALGSAPQVVTQTPAGAEGERAYLYRAGVFEYSLFGAVGEMTPFSLTLQGARGNGSRGAGAVPGQLIKAVGSVTSTGATGTAVELGPAAAGQYLYAALHLMARGTTITAVLESSADDTFEATTTRATLGPLTATGGTWAARVGGPISDTWYRLRVTAITGTHTIACSAGIK